MHNASACPTGRAQTGGRHADATAQRAPFLADSGPTNVPDRILRAMDRPTIDHRGPDFAKLAAGILEDLKAVFRPPVR